MTTARELSARLASLLRREHEAMADFLVALADFDEKRVWLELGHGSLFSYLNRELGLSKGAAFFRNTAARLVRRYPEIVEPLRDGRLCLTSLAHVAKVLTPENKAELLPRFFQRSRSEAKEIVAEILPEAAPPRRAVITAVKPAPALKPTPATTSNAVLPPTSGFPENLLGANSSAANGGLLSHGESTLPPEPKRADVEPVTADLRRLHLTVSKRLLDKLSAARDALSHSKPGATHEEILEAGLDLLLAADAKRKGLVSKPRKTPPPSPPTSAVRCPSATAGVASSHSIQAASADPRTASSSVTSWRARMVGSPPRRIFAVSARSTTSTAPTSTCGALGGASRGAAGRRTGLPRPSTIGAMLLGRRWGKRELLQSTSAGSARRTATPASSAPSAAPARPLERRARTSSPPGTLIPERIVMPIGMSAAHPRGCGDPRRNTPAPFFSSYPLHRGPRGSASLARRS